MLEDGWTGVWGSHSTVTVVVVTYGIAVCPWNLLVALSTLTSALCWSGGDADRWRSRCSKSSGTVASSIVLTRTHTTCTTGTLGPVCTICQVQGGPLTFGLSPAQPRPRLGLESSSTHRGWSEGHRDTLNPRPESTLLWTPLHLGLWLS